MNSQSLARGLAFFSVGLGLTQLIAPRQLSRAIGVDEDNDTLMRLLGLRELGAGLGIMQGNPGTFLWARVGGDIMDLGLLANALRSNPRNRNRVIGAIAAVAGVTALDIAGGILLSRNPAEPEWRVHRDDRTGFTPEDPVALRRRSDELMRQHESGHVRRHENAFATAGADAGSNQDLRNREDQAAREFHPGD